MDKLIKFIIIINYSVDAKPITKTTFGIWKGKA